MWVGGCVTAPAMWASPPGRRRNSVHRSVEMAPRSRFGTFVYTVVTRGSCEQPWRRCNSVHRSVEMASRRRFGIFVYTVAPRVAIRIATRAASGSGPLARTLPPDAPPSAPDHSEPRTSQANNHLSDAKPDKLCPLVGRKDLRPSVRKTLPLVYATRRATLHRDSVKQGDKQVKRVLKSRSCCVCSLSRWGNSGGWCSHRPEIRAFSR